MTVKIVVSVAVSIAGCGATELPLGRMGSSDEVTNAPWPHLNPLLSRLLRSSCAGERAGHLWARPLTAEASLRKPLHVHHRK